jgi:VWFA-related protein
LTLMADDGKVGSSDNHLPIRFVPPLNRQGDFMGMSRGRLAVALSVVPVLMAVATAQQAPQPPAFRTGNTLVPVDVRVLDRDGKSVTDLTQRDFAIRENGVPQTLAHFSLETLGAVTGEPGAPAALRPKPGEALAPPRRRVILLLLGRGFLERPFDAITAAVEFVRTRLLPQDYVAVMAYNRATEFTTEHERIVTVLERFRSEHESIELRLQSTLGGLAGMSGSRRLPTSLQPDIDGVFGAGGLGVRQVQNDQTQRDPQVRRDLKRDVDKQLQAMLENPTGPPPDLLDPAFEEFLGGIAPTMHDAGSVHAGIEYLRFIEGEKRLIFVTEEGFSLPRTESDLSIATAASEARVAIDTIRTGGVPYAALNQRDAQRDGPADFFRRMSAISTLRILASNSGGSTFSNMRPEEAFARIDAATRSQYLLGYYPTDAGRDGRFRRIEVTINRPGVTVLARRGYYARDTAREFDRTRLMTEMRIDTAAALPQTIPDIKITLTTAPGQAADGGRAVIASGTIDTARLGWMQSADGRRRITLELAILCIQEDGLLVGEHRQPLVLTMSHEAYEKALKSGLNYSVPVPVTSTPRQVKVIVYDPANDLVGSQATR